MRPYFWIGFLVSLSGLSAAPCGNVPNNLTVELSGKPYQLASTRDGCWIFATLLPEKAGGAAGVAVFKREEGRVEMLRLVPLAPAALGLALTHDDSTLIAATLGGFAVFDVAKLIQKDADPLIRQIKKDKPPMAFAVAATVSQDDRYAYLAEEGQSQVTIVDIAKAKSGADDPVVARIPAGHGTVSVAAARDGHWLYAVSEEAAEDWGWPAVCSERNPKAEQKKHPMGALVAIDLRSNSVVAKVPAGCEAIRVAIAPGGKAVYVVSQQDDALLAFDPEKLSAGPVKRMTLGPAPGTTAFVDGGRMMIVGETGRFTATDGKPQDLTIVDLAKMAVVGKIAAGAWPRSIAVSEGVNMMVVGNFMSNTLQVMDAAHLAGERAK